MTADEIRALPAGWELDEAIMRALGWEEQPCFEGDVEGYWVTPGGTRYIYEELPDLSGSWEGTGVIVETLNVHGHVTIKSPFFPGARYYAWFDLHDHVDAHPIWVARAVAGPLAVARAALLFLQDNPLPEPAP